MFILKQDHIDRNLFNTNVKYEELNLILNNIYIEIIAPFIPNLIICKNNIYIQCCVFIYFILFLYYYMLNNIFNSN